MSFLDSEENLKKRHKYALGSLVYLEPFVHEGKSPAYQEAGGIYYVVFQSRDCDGSLLYGLALHPKNMALHSCISEESLRPWVEADRKFA